MTVTPYLCAADALAAIDFYQEVFGAELAFPPFIGPDGRVGHSELRIGGSTVMLASTYAEELVIDPLEAGGTTVQLRLEVPDVDAVFDRAVRAGATVLRPVADQPYGERAGKIRDPVRSQLVHRHPGRAPVDRRAQPAPRADLGFAPARIGGGVRGLGGRRRCRRPVARTGPIGCSARLIPVSSSTSPSTWPTGPGPRRSSASCSTGRSWPAASPAATTSPTRPRPAASPAAARDTGVTLYFRVADIRAAVARVRELGGRGRRARAVGVGLVGCLPRRSGHPVHPLRTAAEGY